jgi:dTDP-4-dehydrorhamnose 3,5-epimerase
MSAANMSIVETGIEGLLVVETKAYADDRGLFMETFNASRYEKLGIANNFVQDNYSLSKKNVLRGLHFQKPPHAQAKLVRVLNGRVYDVAVDIRTRSKTFGHHFGIELSGENKLSLFIPVGFAHGFCVLSETAEFFYKCTDVYNPESDSGIKWNDPSIGIRWPIQNPLISPKDMSLGDIASVRGVF